MPSEISETFVKEHIDRWTNAWNDHNIDDIMSMYADNIEFSSPKISLLMPEITTSNKTRIINKQDLKRYFSIGLERFPKLRFMPIDFLLKGHKVLLEYIAEPKYTVRWKVIEKFEFEGKFINRSSAFYGPEETTD
jgi:hypothetical protein